MRRLSLATLVILVSIIGLASPVMAGGGGPTRNETAASTVWMATIWFTPSCTASTPQITKVFPGQSLCVFANISASTDKPTADTTPLLKLNLPDGFVMEKPWTWDVSTGGGGSYKKYEYEVHFYALEDGNPSWYDSTDTCADSGWCTEENLPDGTNWTTNWSIRVESGTLPKNHTFAIVMYDAPANSYTADNFYAYGIPLYGGYGNKEFKDLEVSEALTITTSVNASCYQGGSGACGTNPFDIYGFQIGETVRINGSVSPSADVDSINITVIKPAGSINNIARFYKEVSVTGGTFEVLYSLTKVLSDRRGFYRVNLVAYDSTNASSIGSSTLEFQVGEEPTFDHEHSTLGHNSSLFRSHRRAPPDTLETCKECHNKIFTNTSELWFQDQGAAPGEPVGNFGTPGQQAEHPGLRPAPSRNCYWYHLVHTDAPQHNSTRAQTATPEPGTVMYYEKVDGADEETAQITALYSSPPGTNHEEHFVWTDTCAMCHLKVRNPMGPTYQTERIRSEGCVRSGDSPACHIITMDGTHENAPSCEACHGGDDPNIPDCENCHVQPLAWVNRTTPTTATIEPASTDITSLVEVVDANAGNLHPGDEDDAKYFYIRFGPRFREKATLGVAWNTLITTDSASGNVSAYYNDSNGVFRLFGYTGTLAAVDVWLNMSTNVSFSNLGTDEDGNFLIKLNVSGTIGNKKVVGIDYSEMNVRALDNILVNDTHEGLECLNCHGHAHNATKDIYCASCKGDLLVSTSVHKHNFSATEKVEGVNTSNWCMECHGWQHNQAPAESRADNGSATQGFILRVPKCYNCHNNNVTNTSWRRYSEMEIPPWGIRVHGEAAAENQRVNTTNYGEGTNVNGSCRFCHNSQHNVSFANQPQNPQCQDPNCHGSNATNGYNPSSATVGPRINWTHGENFISLGAPTCVDCHNNRTVRVFNTTANSSILINASIHLTNRSMGYWNMTPFNITRTNSLGNVSSADCKKCHNIEPWDTIDSCGDGNCHSPSAGTLLIHSANMNVDSNLDGLHSTGGPDCGASGCHDAFNNPGAPSINFSAVEQGIHGQINRLTGNTTTLTKGEVTKACWACHNYDVGKGVQPPDGEMSNASTGYKNPAACFLCHNGTALFTNVASAPAVYEHYLNASNVKAASNVTNGSTDIEKISNSCVQCHNKGEMVLPANDPDFGSSVTDVDVDGVLGGNITFAHYGRNRSIPGDQYNLRKTRDSTICGSGGPTNCSNLNNFPYGGVTYTYTDCSYCHQNATTPFNSSMNPHYHAQPHSELEWSLLYGLPLPIRRREHHHKDS
jgi:hypothetical protein